MDGPQGRNKGGSTSKVDAAKEFLAKEGFDPVYGARPLKRAIQKHVQDRLARAVLTGKITPEGKVVLDVDELNNGLTVK